MTRPWQGVIRIVTVCYAAALTVGSLLPSGTETLRGWDAALTPDLQNALHAPAYAGLAVLGFLSLFRPGRPPVRIALLAAGAAIALGCALELAQLSVPGRTCSLPDGLMNGIGIIAGFLGILAWRWVSRRSERRQKARRVVRRHYHERGWSSPHIRYLNLLSSLMQKASVEVLDVGCGRTFPMAKYTAPLKGGGKRLTGQPAGCR